MDSRSARQLPLPTCVKYHSFSGEYGGLARTALCSMPLVEISSQQLTPLYCDLFMRLQYSELMRWYCSNWLQATTDMHPLACPAVATRNNKASLFGKTEEEKTQVLQWAMWANTNLLGALAAWWACFYTLYCQGFNCTHWSLFAGSDPSLLDLSTRRPPMTERPPPQSSSASSTNTLPTRPS